MNSPLKGAILFVIFLLQQCCFAADNDPQSDQVVIAVNITVKQNSISKHGLSAIFKMRLHQWKDGLPITVFVLADEDPVHKIFCKKILNVFPHQMRRIWNRLVFSGSGQAPIKLNNVDEMVNKLKSTPGAIGYLRSRHVGDGIKALLIHAEGKQ